jgi:hypothetical protein
MHLRINPDGANQSKSPQNWAQIMMNWVVAALKGNAGLKVAFIKYIQALENAGGAK